MDIPIINLNDLKITINKKVILQIPKLKAIKGEKICIIGENGAGKTTFILALANLLNFQGECISFYDKKVGKDIKSYDYLKRIAIVFQEPMLLNDSVFNNVAIALKFRNLPKEEIKTRTDRVLSKLKIKHLTDRKVNTLSGGESQRVNLARALVLDPEILFLDEPFSAIDRSYKDNLISDLSEIIEDKGITLFMTTHDRYEALRLCERFIVLEGGKIIGDSNLEDFLKSPCNEYAANFIGYETIISGVVEDAEDGTYKAKVGDKLITGIGNFERGDKVMICINPENVSLSKHPLTEDLSIRNCFEGFVTEVNNLGFYYRVKVNCGFDILSYITKKSVEELKIKKDSKVYVQFKALSIHTFKK